MSNKPDEIRQRSDQNIKNFKNKCQVPYDSAHDNAFVVFQPVKSDM